MIMNISSNQLSLAEYNTTFLQKLKPTNKWVILAHVIPWDDFEGIYAKKTSKGMGQTSISPRLAIAALIIKHLEILDDRGFVQALEENVYMLYFAGYSSFSNKQPFDPSLLVEMRHRMGMDVFDQMSMLIIQKVILILEQMNAENKNAKFKNGPKNKLKNKNKNTDQNDNNDHQNTSNTNIE